MNSKKLKVAATAYIADELTTSLLNTDYINFLLLVGFNANVVMSTLTMASRQDHIRMPDFYENWIDKYIEFVIFAFRRYFLPQV